jgi:hypothetical protein
MKHFEPIVIQEQTQRICKCQLENGITREFDVVFYNNTYEQLRIPMSKQAATRLRDALNTILND